MPLAPSAGQQINRREPLTSRRWNHRGRCRQGDGCIR